MPIGQDSILDVNLQKALGASTSLAYSGSIPVTASTPTTLITFSDTVDRVIGAIWVSGQGYAKYDIYLNTVLKGTYRNSTNYSANMSMGTSLLILTGDVIDVKVTHYYTGETLDFECSLWGA